MLQCDRDDDRARKFKSSLFTQRHRPFITGGESENKIFILKLSVGQWCCTIDRVIGHRSIFQTISFLMPLLMCLVVWFRITVIHIKLHVQFNHDLIEFIFDLSVISITVMFSWSANFLVHAIHPTFFYVSLQNVYYFTNSSN